MEEKTYKVMGRSGAMNLTVGILTMIAGIAAGVLLIISGAKLIGQKSKIMF
ncbi:MAG: hypothetical protein IJX86_06855 [Lachnospiraceae bacterium]|mgnify:CR=1 FL=1|nr:hypothetical protein [Lachnospiraceae bacterium]MBR3683642.1 hypothetical protein [Lachnospiraceae bacterium]